VRFVGEAYVSVPEQKETSLWNVRHISGLRRNLCNKNKMWVCRKTPSSLLLVPFCHCRFLKVLSTVAHTRETWNTYKMLVWNCKGKDHLRGLNKNRLCSIGTNSRSIHSKVQFHNYNNEFLNFITSNFLKMAVLWVAALCSLVEVYLHFIGTCCLHHQGDEWWRQQAILKCWQTSIRLHSATSQRTVTFIYVTVRTWYLAWILLVQLTDSLWARVWGM
jgi:hypothetical protein